MRPELFSILGVTFFAYRTMLGLSFVVCSLLMARESRRPGRVELSPLIGVWAMLGALLGARIFYVIQYEGLSRILRALYVWDGGLVFYGGLIGGLAAVWAHLRVNRAPVLASFDVMSPFLALGEAITRIGCFLNGCCFGEPSSLPWAVAFPSPGFAVEAQREAGLLDANAVASLPVHPTQLYMTVGLVAVFAVLLRRLRKGPWNGSVFTMYLLLYGVVRFVVEILRGDSARSVFGMTVSQAISLGLVVAAGIVFAARRTRKVRP
ncbi:MAG: prolipoprotein diacylglyceryl transferase [Candidatus Hydrogenedentes bacterium]|nr:prolipoprotein diacylglyceryl transferase [Candidatus Hydrogenedentota bacterium]